MKGICENNKKEKKNWQEHQNGDKDEVMKKESEKTVVVRIKFLLTAKRKENTRIYKYVN